MIQQLFKRTILVLIAISSSIAAMTGTIAYTVGLTEKDAMEAHKKAGASVQVLDYKDAVYSKTIRARYKDQSGTFLITDVITQGDSLISKQTIVSKNPDLLGGLATWFEKQKDYKSLGNKKWQTEANGRSIVIYLQPVDQYREGFVIEEERFK